MPHLAFFDTIILLGALQGFIISGVLFFKKPTNLSGKLLAAIIFLLALACLDVYLFNQAAIGSSAVFAFIEAVVPLIMAMPIGPLAYFYTQSQINPDFKLSRADRGHFYPVIIDLLPHIAAILAIAAALMRIIHRLPFDLGNWIDTYNVYADIPRWISISIYVILSFRLLQKSKSLRTESPARKRWLIQFLGAFGAFQFIWLLYLVPYVIPAFSDRLLNTVNWYPVYLPLALLIYWLGIKGFVISYHQQQAVKASSSATASLSTQTIADIADTLHSAMITDGLYLDPELSLARVANHTGIAQKSISAVLNQHLHKSFNEFVNEYRVDAFKQMILSENIAHLTMAGVASKCGFNSQATFQRTFKQFTGLSPSAFRKNAEVVGNQQLSNPDLSAI